MKDIAKVYGGTGNDEWWKIYKYKDCHTGNHLIGTLFKGSLYAGGWTRGASPKADWAVIDLASYTDRPSASGNAFKNVMGKIPSRRGPVLTLPIQDFGTPDWTIGVWTALAEDVRQLLKHGTSVLVACTGGHGRTGMVVAILSVLLGFCKEADPVAWIRRVYCTCAVETYAQELYVYSVLGLKAPQVVKASKSLVYEDYDLGVGVTRPNDAKEPRCRVCDLELSEKYGDDMDRKLCVSCRRWYDNSVCGVDRETGPVKDSLGDCCEYCGGHVKDAHGDCASCGTPMDAEKVYCQFCGVGLTQDEDPFYDCQLCEECKAYDDKHHIIQPPLK